MDRQIKSIEKFPEQNILVMGDVMLDEYIFGDVSRINPEAPVPVLNVSRTEYRLGGAANTAHNITSLGGKCDLIGLTGKDDASDMLIKMLEEKNIKCFLIKDSACRTTKKTRIIAQNQQVIRVDWENSQSITSAQSSEIIDYIKQNKFDLILISDYNKGFLTKDLVEKLKHLNIKIIADPKPDNIEIYTDVFALTPNLKEAQQISGREEIQEVGKEIIDKYRVNLVLTLGKKGVSLFEKETGQYYYVPTQAKEVYDVSGAGDTFAAAFALGVAGGVSLYESVILANNAAGIAVSKLGTASVSAQELIRSFQTQKSKVREVDELKEIIRKKHSQGKKVVFSNGCFDILHVGHTQLLNKAKSFGDVLILGLNTDESIKKIKGPDRPVNNQQDRAEVLSNLQCVDYIVFFSEQDPTRLISELQPDIHVKGGDYDPNDYTNMPEAKVIHEYGGRVEIIDYIDGKSTTRIINKIRK